MPIKLKFYLKPGGIQHSDDADEGEADLVLDELGGVAQVVLVGVQGGVGGGEGEAPGN